MSSQTLTDEVMAAHHSETVALIVLRTMTGYAQVIDGTYSDPDCTPAKRHELAEIAASQGWPELWRRHGLTFPSVPPDVPRPSHPADAPETASSDADFRRDIETRAPAPKPSPEPPTAAPAPPARVLTPEPGQKPAEMSPGPADAQPLPSAPESPPTAPSSAPTTRPAMPKPKPRAGESTDAFGDAIIEHFTCVKCGSTFTRPKTRGRKPRLCSACLSPSRRKRRRT